MLPLVIVNPKSASGSTRDRWSQTASDLRAHFGAFSVVFTKAPGDGITLARRAAESGREFIIACGGDGTVNEVANGILQSGCAAELGILPSGTGGDFRRTIKMPVANRDAAAALRNGTKRMIDVGQVSFTAHDGSLTDRYFVNVSSFGLAAAVVKSVKSRSFFQWLPIEALRGKANFAVSTLEELMNLAPLRLRITIDDGPERSISSVNFCVANARYFGGGMMIAPDAKLSDGFLDIVNIGDVSSFKIIASGLSLYRGTHTRFDEVTTTLARSLRVEPLDPSKNVLIETDGELPGRLPASYRVIPSALAIRVP